MASRDSKFDSEDFGLKLYNRFPPKYIEDDISTNYSLKRYLRAIGDGGFKYSIEEWNGILDSVNPDSCDAVFLPALLTQYGFKYFHNIPERYLRYFLPRLSEIWSKKGSLDVIEYAVSTLSGIETTTTVTTDSDGNPHVDVHLLMDNSLGDYFPDAIQFNKILDSFLPFYLSKTLIYAYLFVDNQRLWLADPFSDKVVHTISEYALIPYGNGTRPSIVLNNPNVVLNDTFVLNGDTYYDVEPDSLFDGVSTNYLTQADLNVAESVSNEIITAPVHDSKVLHNDESRFETVKIEDNFRFYATLNTDLMLNVDFYTNRGAEDRAELNLVEEFRVDACTLTPYYSEAEVYQDNSNDMYQGLFTNVVESPLNTGYLLVPDCYDVIFNPNVGTYVTFPSLYKYVGA